MKKWRILAMIAVALSSPAFAWKDIAHYVSLPLIDGAGIYSSVMVIRDGEHGATKAAGVANLSLLGVNSALGALKLFGPEDAQPAFRAIHRITGFVVTAAALWLSVSASIDDGTNATPAHYVSYGYAALTAVPLIVFSF